MHQFSYIKSKKEFTKIVEIKAFLNFFCFLMEGSGSVRNNDGFGRPKNRRIRIHCSKVKYLKPFNLVGCSPAFLLNLENLPCSVGNIHQIFSIFVRFFFFGAILHVCFQILILPFMLLLMRSAARGAHNIIFGAVEDKEKLVNGGFYRSAVAFFRIAKI